MEKIPDKIYLQVHGDAYVEDIEDVREIESENITWSLEKVFDSDIEYHRAAANPDAAKPKVYISLPITGYDLTERKAYAVGVAWWLEREGFTPVNPLENGINADAPIEAHYKRDLHLMTDCEGIILCGDWQRSKGCKLEHKVALACGLKIATTDMRVSKQLAMLKGGEE